MRTDGRTDMTKLIAAFHNFANSPKIQKKKKINHKVQFMMIVKSTCFDTGVPSSECILLTVFVG